MYIKLRGLDVEFWVADEANSQRSCGESRTKWVLIHRCSLRTLAKAVLDLASGRYARASL